MRIIFSIFIFFSLSVSSFANDYPNSFNPLVEKVIPSVVSIKVTIIDENKSNAGGSMPMPGIPPEFEFFFKDFFKNIPRENYKKAPRKRESSGSGFIINAKKGIVVTNNHVIHGGKNFEITLQDERVVSAKLIGADPLTDIALLKIDKPSNLKEVSFGDSNNAKVGDWVVAVGNPHGLGGTVTKGIISARSRNINSGLYDDYIQTDAPINPGNSGGPLFNTKGEVIGINSIIISSSGGSSGLGFAIPSKLAKDIVNSLEKFGRVKRAWLGVELQPVDRKMLESIGIKQDYASLILKVGSGSPADKAGIKSDDIILKIDGIKISKKNRLPHIVATRKIGKKIKFEGLRNGKKKVFYVKLVEREKDQKFDLKDKKKEQNKAQELLGMKFLETSPVVNKKYGFKDNAKGLILKEIDSKSVAYGILPVGSLIKKVNHIDVYSFSDFKKIIIKSKSLNRRYVLFSISLANGTQSYLTVPIN